MFNGTSMASPQAAGGAALLVSAAKQTNVQKQPAQLRQAINSSARYIERLRAFDQGNGLFDVGAAWNLLKTTIKPVNITSSVAVDTVLSGFLGTPGVGQGIYDREGVSAGQSYTREYTFTRTSGGGSKTYNLSWTDNDGTFSTAASLALPLNTPTRLLVSVNPATAGEHAAILNLDDPATTGIDYQTMNVVIAAEDFTVANNYTITKSGSVERNQSLSFFFRIPAGTPAFKVDFSGPRPQPGPARPASCAGTPMASGSTRTPAPPATSRPRPRAAPATAGLSATRRPGSGK